MVAASELQPAEHQVKNTLQNRLAELGFKIDHQPYEPLDEDATCTTDLNEYFCDRKVFRDFCDQLGEAPNSLAKKIQMQMREMTEVMTDAITATFVGSEGYQIETNRTVIAKSGRKTLHDFLEYSGYDRFLGLFTSDELQPHPELVWQLWEAYFARADAPPNPAFATAVDNFINSLDLHTHDGQDLNFIKNQFQDGIHPLQRLSFVAIAKQLCEPISPENPAACEDSIDQESWPQKLIQLATFGMAGLQRLGYMDASSGQVENNLRYGTKQKKHNRWNAVINGLMIGTGITLKEHPLGFPFFVMLTSIGLSRSITLQVILFQLQQIDRKIGQVVDYHEMAHYLSTSLSPQRDKIKIGMCIYRVNEVQNWL